MPELPEVEVICRGVRPLLIGHTVTRVFSSGKSLRHPVPAEPMQRELIGQQILEVERRAKYLQVGFANGSMLIIHLGMTGNLGIFSPNSPRAKHDHVFWGLNNSTELRYNDIRRFGSIRLLTRKEAAEREETIFRTTGPEPFSNLFSADYLRLKAKGKSLSVKQFIMTGEVVAGIGNIYANESLFAAGIRPARKIGTLSRREWQSLVTEIRRVLDQAIECGGSTISDFVNAGQEPGYFQINFQVYGREGEPCNRCSRRIEKAKIGGRASYYCPGCQR